MTIPIYVNKEMQIKVTKWKSEGKTPPPPNTMIQRQQGGERRDTFCFSEIPDKRRGKPSTAMDINLLARVRWRNPDACFSSNISFKYREQKKSSSWRLSRALFEVQFLRQNYVRAMFSPEKPPN